MALVSCSYAQKGVDIAEIALEAGIPTGDFGDATNVGVGGGLRFLFGVAKSGEITATSGYTSYKLKDLPSGVNAHFYLIPILVGYRHRFNGLYLEPQIGPVIYGLSASAGGQSDSNSKAGFTWAAGLGYQGETVDIGIRYQSGKTSDSGSPFSLVGIHLGFLLPMNSL